MLSASYGIMFSMEYFVSCNFETFTSLLWGLCLYTAPPNPPSLTELEQLLLLSVITAFKKGTDGFFVVLDVFVAVRNCWRYFAHVA